jgi:hypothetical protein
MVRKVSSSEIIGLVLLISHGAILFTSNVYLLNVFFLKLPGTSKELLLQTIYI